MLQFLNYFSSLLLEICVDVISAAASPAPDTALQMSLTSTNQRGRITPLMLMATIFVSERDHSCSHSFTHYLYAKGEQIYLSRLYLFSSFPSALFPFHCCVHVFYNPPKQRTKAKSPS